MFAIVVVLLFAFAVPVLVILLFGRIFLLDEERQKPVALQTLVIHKHMMMKIVYMSCLIGLIVTQ